LRIISDLPDAADNAAAKPESLDRRSNQFTQQLVQFAGVEQQA